MAKSREVNVRLVLDIKRPYRFLWLKYVRGFRSDVHCARSLVGPYSRKLFRPATTLDREARSVMGSLDVVLDEHEAPYLYLCGVTSRWADNLHLVLVEDSDRVDYEDGYVRLTVHGARALPIPALPADHPMAANRSFATCRNYQFGYAYLDHSLQDIGGPTDP